MTVSLYNAVAVFRPIYKEYSAELVVRDVHTIQSITVLWLSNYFFKREKWTLSQLPQAICKMEKEQ